MSLLFIDFPIMPENASKASWMFCGFLYFFILAYFYNEGINNCGTSNVKSKSKRFSFLVFIFALCAFYCGDWSHMQTIVTERVGAEYIEGVGFEKVYTYIINAVNGNYLLFRTILWGGALVLIIQTFKYSNLDPYKSLYFLFAVYITSLAYSRAGVALSIFYFGFVTLFQSQNSRNKWTVLLGIAIIVASTFFHRSLIVLLVLAPLAIIPINRRNSGILILCIIILAFLWNRIFQTALGSLMASDEYSRRVEIYESLAGSNTITFDQNGLFYLWYKAIVHIPFLVCVTAIYKHSKHEALPFNIQAVFRFSVILYVFMILMLFTYGSASAFYYRYEGMLYIPITIMVTYLYQNCYITPKTYKILFWFCALALGKDFIYRFLFT